MNFTVFNKWAICVMFGSWDRYAFIPYIEYVPGSKNIIFCFWKWHMIINIEKIKKGGEE